VETQPGTKTRAARHLRFITASDAIVTRTDIADAMRKLQAHDRDPAAENVHVSGHGDAVDGQVAKSRTID